MSLDDDLVERLLLLLRHPEEDMAKQGTELFCSLLPEERRTILRGRDLQRVNLAGVDLSGVDLVGAELSFAKLQGSTLRGACLDGATLTGAHLQTADLSGASVRMARLSSAQLQDACLSGVNLRGSQLESADLRDASLVGADLSRTDLRGAWMTVRDKAGCRLEGAIYNAYTRWQGGHPPADAWLFEDETLLAGVDLSHRRLGRLCRSAGANLAGVRLEESVLDNAELIGVRLDGAVLRGSRWCRAVFRGASLVGADLSGADLSGADLSGADLSGAQVVGLRLDGARLEGVTLASQDLSRVSMRGCQLRGRHLSRQLRGADLGEANLHGAVLSGADLTGAILQDAVLTGADLSGADLSGADLLRAHLKGALLPGARLSGACLHHARLVRASLQGADLRGADLRAAILREADLSGADLSGALLQRVGFQGARLRETRLEGALLYRAGLQGADMSEAVGVVLTGSVVDGCTQIPATAQREGAIWLGPGVDLRGVDLRGVWMYGADLRGADLREADLREVTLTRANLCDADLRGARLEGARLGLCDTSAQTRWPASMGTAVPPVAQVLMPQPLVPPVEAVLNRSLASGEGKLVRAARLALARLGQGAEAMRLARHANAPLEDRLAIAAHCRPDALLPEDPPLVRLVAESAQRAASALTRAILHPGGEGEHKEVRLAHRILLGELRPPLRDEVWVRLQARIAAPRLGGRALRRLRGVYGLRGMDVGLLEARVLEGVRHGPAELRRALVRILPGTALADERELMFIASIEDAAVRAALLDRRHEPEATQDWIKTAIRDPGLERSLRTNLIFRVDSGPELRGILLQQVQMDPWLLYLIPLEPVDDALVTLLRGRLQSTDDQILYQTIGWIAPLLIHHPGLQPVFLPLLLAAWGRSRGVWWRGPLQETLRAVLYRTPDLEASFGAVGISLEPYPSSTLQAHLTRADQVQTADRPGPRAEAPVQEEQLWTLLEQPMQAPQVWRWMARHPERAAARLREGLGDVRRRPVSLKWLVRLSQQIQRGLVPWGEVQPLLWTAHRRPAAELLGVLGEVAALPALCGLASRGDRGDRRAAVHAISQLLLEIPTGPRP